MVINLFLGDVFRRVFLLFGGLGLFLMLHLRSGFRLCFRFLGGGVFAINGGIQRSSLGCCLLFFLL